jgi:hypothetical protein
MMTNRFSSPMIQPQADYLLTIVRRPPGWLPESVDSVPHHGDVLDEHLVASFAEAKEDMLRCNEIALRCNIDKWAIVRHAGSDI